ncbi:type 1 glutamine amidotransferase [Candidatus Sumerlaeota bacterium]|nr:type 1 glutamine amidotransferase [Candidatus Sumerlaeota bacterium]
MLRIHYVQHVPFETPANIAEWARERGHPLTGTRPYAGETLPSPESVDWLVVLGGPMSVHDVGECPWLADEKRFILEALSKGCGYLGICLGAQILADALGAHVAPNRHKEIGWHPVTLTPEATRCSLFRGWADRFIAFHWHGETFAVPEGAIPLASSEACVNQAFAWGDRALALQFHLEYSRSSIEAMFDSADDDLDSGPYVQSREAILAQADRVEQTRELLYRLLNAMEAGMSERRMARNDRGARG